MLWIQASVSLTLRDAPAINLTTRICSYDLKSSEKVLNDQWSLVQPYRQPAGGAVTQAVGLVGPESST